MISRALNDKELDYATNERELLAVVWALKKLQNYLYGARDLRIFTDHQPLAFAVSNKNTNAKIKRWKAFIEEHNAVISYKPGKENLVADALSLDTRSMHWKISLPTLQFTVRSLLPMLS